MTDLDETTMERLRSDGDQPAPLFEETRRCAFAPCGKPLARKEREKPSQFATRTFCDISCAARNAAGSVILGDLGDRDCVCGGVMRRRDNESLARFSNRRFCSPACAARNADRKTPQKRARRPLQTKTCTVCGGQMQRRASEGITKWESRESCSISCAAKKRRAKEAAARAEAAASGRVCARPGCGKPLVQRVGEPPVRFAERRFCDRACRNAGNRVLGLPESKRCEGCSVVMERRGLAPYVWRVKRFCSPGCASRSRARVEPKVVPSKDRHRRPVPPVLEPVVRPDPAALVPDPAVVEMDRKRVRALRLLNDDLPHERVAVAVGVSIAQVHRWDR